MEILEKKFLSLETLRKMRWGFEITSKFIDKKNLKIFFINLPKFHSNKNKFDLVRILNEIIQEKETMFKIYFLHKLESSQPQDH